MTTDIHRLIAAVNPDLFCEVPSRREVRRIVEGAEADQADIYTQAVRVVRRKECNTGEAEQLHEASPFELAGLRHPCERHQLVFDSLGEAPEQLYFNLLHFLGRGGWRLEKLSDKIWAAQGAAMRRSLDQSLIDAQEHAAQLFRLAQDTLRRLLRDWEELGGVAAEHPSREAASGLATPSDVRPTPNGTQNMRRLLLLSAIRSELEALKMYASWLRPFLILGSANHFESAKSPDLIDAFNTTLFRVELLASNGGLLEAELADGTLPSWLNGDRFRRALPVLVVEVLLRTAPTQARGGGFHHRGCIDITLTSYALREDELGVLQAERERADLRRMIQALGVMDQRILGRLEAELNRLNMVEGTGIQPGQDDTNPFAVLWTAVKSLIRWRDPVRPTGLSSSDARLTPDSVPEQVLRSRALILARQACLEAFFELKAQLPRPASERRALA